MMTSPGFLKFSRLVLGLGYLVVQCSCSRNHQLKGEIFIVTAGHESIKLGLVEVRAYRPSQINPIIESVKGDLSKLKTTLAPIEAQLQALKRRADADQQPVGSALWENADNAVSHCNTVSERIESQYKHIRSVAHFFERLPDPIATTKTDSDGKFTIILPSSGETIICAAASRKVPGSTEHYYWMVKANPSATTTITLSNDNLATSDSPQSLIHAPDYEGESESSEESSVENLKSELITLEKQINTLEANVGSAARSVVRTTQSISLDIATRYPDGNVYYIRKVLPSGMDLDFISKEGSEVRIRYQGTEYLIPISATDLK